MREPGEGRADAAIAAIVFGRLLVIDAEDTTK
jgi:hypothetical protein